MRVVNEKGKEKLVGYNYSDIENIVTEAMTFWNESKNWNHLVVEFKKFVKEL